MSSSEPKSSYIKCSETFNGDKKYEYFLFSTANYSYFKTIIIDYEEVDDMLKVIDKFKNSIEQNQTNSSYGYHGTYETKNEVTIEYQKFNDDSLVWSLWSKSFREKDNVVKIEKLSKFLNDFKSAVKTIQENKS